MRGVDFRGGSKRVVGSALGVCKRNALKWMRSMSYGVGEGDTIRGERRARCSKAGTSAVVVLAASTGRGGEQLRSVGRSVRGMEIDGGLRGCLWLSAGSMTGMGERTWSEGVRACWYGAACVDAGSQHARVPRM